MILEILLSGVTIYILCGFAFAVPFIWTGVERIDPHAANGSWGFRLIIIPGTILLWPLLVVRWSRGLAEPPEENNAHRRAARARQPGIQNSRSALP
jgi:hypothetical protein